MICYFVYLLILFVLQLRQLSEIYKNENIPVTLKTITGLNFKVDWVKRLYCVVNTKLLSNDDSASIPVTYGPDGKPSAETYIKQLLIKKLNLVNEYMQYNVLWELLLFDIKQIDTENYLLVLTPTNFESFRKWLKYAAIEFAFIIIFITFYCIFF